MPGVPRVTPQTFNMDDFFNWLKEGVSKTKGTEFLQDLLKLLGPIGSVIDTILKLLPKADTTRRDAAYRLVDEMAQKALSTLTPMRPGTIKSGALVYEPASLTVQATQESEGFLLGAGNFLAPYDQKITVRYSLYPHDGYRDQAGIRAVIVGNQGDQLRTIWDKKNQLNCSPRWGLHWCDDPSPLQGQDTIDVYAGGYAVVIVGSHTTCQGEVTVEYDSAVMRGAPSAAAPWLPYAIAAGGGIAIATMLTRTRRA